MKNRQFIVLLVVIICCFTALYLKQQNNSEELMFTKEYIVNVDQFIHDKFDKVFDDEYYNEQIMNQLDYIADKIEKDWN